MSEDDEYDAVESPVYSYGRAGEFENGFGGGERRSRGVVIIVVVV